MRWPVRSSCLMGCCAPDSWHRYATGTNTATRSLPASTGGVVKLRARVSAGCGTRCGHEHGAVLKVAIIGAGLGGLAAACALQQADIDIDVYEQSDELREVGAGVQITPNATRVIASLGLAEKLAQFGSLAKTGDARRWSDFSVISSIDLGDTIRQFGQPWYSAHRADLQTMLANALNDGVVHLGHRLTDLVETDGSVRLSFDGAPDATADVVIGADGIHSRVRTILFGAAKPRFTGIVAYRGLTPASAVTDVHVPRGSTIVMGPGQHFVYYPVSAGRNVNWVAMEPRNDWTLESWTEPATKDEALVAYQGWAPQLHTLINTAGLDGRQIYRWALYDRDPLPTWGHGRISLLGDAAHPMLPFLAQGAAQAFEDAAVLARCLQRTDPVDALRTYEDLRRERTATVQLVARHNSVLFHLPDGPQQQARDAVMSSAGPGSPHPNTWIFEYDADQVTAHL